MIFGIPLFATTLVGLVACIGIIAAWVAAVQVRNDGKDLDKLRSLEADKAAWRDLFKTPPKDWLGQRGLPLDSHVGDLISAVRGGWMANRLPTPAELHATIVRRERLRGSARLSGGIAAFLLVCGIAGTLTSIHPILKIFQIGIHADGSVEEAQDSAKRVTGMINSLGDAFMPSLVALVGTVLIAVCRGVYDRKANRLASQLDRFAVDELFGKFRSQTVGEQFEAIKEDLNRVAERLLLRDEAFSRSIESLNEAVAAFGKGAPQFRGAVEKMDEVCQRLTSHAEPLFGVLDRTLGGESEFVQSVGNLVQTARTNTAANEALQQSIAGSITFMKEAAAVFHASGKAVEDSVGDIPKVINSAFAKGREGIRAESGQIQESLKAFNEELATVPEALKHLQSEVAAVPGKIDKGFAIGCEGIRSEGEKLQDSLKRFNSDLARVPEAIAAGSERGVAVMKAAATDIGAHAVSQINEAAGKAGDLFVQPLGQLRAVSLELRENGQEAERKIGEAAGHARQEFSKEIGAVVVKMGATKQQLEEITQKWVSVKPRENILKRMWAGIRRRKAGPVDQT